MSYTTKQIDSLWKYIEQNLVLNNLANLLPTGEYRENAMANNS